MSVPEKPSLTPKDELYLRQVELLKTFLKTGAITKAQFDLSLRCLTQKMYPDGASTPPVLDIE